MYEILTPPPAYLALIPQQHVIHQASKYNRYTLSLFVNFYSFFSFWIACDTPSIEVAQQKIGSSTEPAEHIYTQQIDNKIFQYPRHREKPLILSTSKYNTNQKNKNNQVHLGPIYN